MTMRFLAGLLPALLVANPVLASLVLQEYPATSVTRVQTFDNLAPATQNANSQITESNRTGYPFYYLTGSATQDQDRFASEVKLSAQANPDINSVYYDVSIAGYSSTTLRFAVYGPSQTVRLGLGFTLSVDGTTDFSGAAADLTVMSAGNTNLDLKVGCGYQTSISCVTGDALRSIGTYFYAFNTNTIYDTTVTASAALYPLLAGQFRFSDGSVTAVADPYFFIDPSQPNADQYTLAFSPGFQNVIPVDVPEPKSWAMLIVCLGILGMSRLLSPRNPG